MWVVASGLAFIELCILQGRSSAFYLPVIYYIKKNGAFECGQAK
jgi:hypothetical protein